MRNDDALRREAVLEAIDAASGREVPRHWSTWRHVIAEAVCAAVEWKPPTPPPPRCPGCDLLVDGTERLDTWSGSENIKRVTWMCCGHIRSYGDWRSFGRRYEDADTYEPPQ